MVALCVVKVGAPQFGMGYFSSLINLEITP